MDPNENTYKGLDQILDRAIHDIGNLDKFVTLCMQGIREGTSASEFPRLRRKIDKLQGLPDPFPTEETYENAVEQGKKLEVFARDEVKYGFPYLLNLASVRLWGVLEGDCG